MSLIHLSIDWFCESTTDWPGQSAPVSVTHIRCSTCQESTMKSWLLGMEQRMSLQWHCVRTLSLSKLATSLTPSGEKNDCLAAVSFVNFNVPVFHWHWWQVSQFNNDWYLFSWHISYLSNSRVKLVIYHTINTGYYNLLLMFWNWAIFQSMKTCLFLVLTLLEKTL